MSAIANTTISPNIQNTIGLQSRKRSRKVRQDARPANDVTYEVNCPAAALTFYKFKPQSFLLSEQVLADVEAKAQYLFDKAVLENVASKLQMVRDLYRSGLISNDCMTIGMSHLDSGNSASLQEWIESNLGQVKQVLVEKAMSEAKVLVDSIPFGDGIWEQLAESKLYGFHYYSDKSTPLQLRYCALDFFAHYHVDAEKIANESVRKLYYAVLSKLMAFGDGAWQQDINCYGLWDFAIPTTQTDFDLLKVFVDEISDMDVFNAAIHFKEHGQVAAIKSFLESIDESRFLDINEILDSEDDGEFECYKESLAECFDFVRAEYLCNHLGLSGERLSWETLHAKQAEIVDDNCKTLQILRAVLNHSALFDEAESAQLTRNDVLSFVEETHPSFGVVLCPFADGSSENDALHTVSENMYQQFMEAGEAEDWWIVNTGHSSWLDVVLNRVKATTLLMSLVIGQTVVLPEQAAL